MRNDHSPSGAVAILPKTNLCPFEGCYKSYKTTGWLNRRIREYYAGETAEHNDQIRANKTSPGPEGPGPQNTNQRVNTELTDSVSPLNGDQGSVTCSSEGYNASYKCEFCDKIYYKQKSLINHLSAKHEWSYSRQAPVLARAPYKNSIVRPREALGCPVARGVRRDLVLVEGPPTG